MLYYLEYIDGNLCYSIFVLGLILFPQFWAAKFGMWPWHESIWQFFYSWVGCKYVQNFWLKKELILGAVYTKKASNFGQYFKIIGAFKYVVLKYF